MAYVGGRKSLVVFFVVASLFSSPALLADSVGLPQVRNATDAFLMGRSAQPGRTPSGSIRAQATGLAPAGFREVRDDDGTILAYVADLEPRGFVALSADTDIAPVIAYSFKASFPAGGDKANPLYRMLRTDMKLRAAALAEHPELKTPETARLWDLLAAGQADVSEDASFQQWPPEGATSTGGWLETAWGQGEPYNTFCPLDSVDGIRSYAGCVATAFAQLVHYHQVCEVTFNEDDSYTAYTGIQIDDDGGLYDFPSFTKLNGYLNKIRSKYSAGVDLNDVDVAALSFACGVAVQMDYGSDGSGASLYAVQEALLNGFGYYSADMFGGLSDAAFVALQENMINGLPALLSFSPPDGWGGHVVVCDGYNTDGEYHLNFGWGTTSPQEITEAWYRLPTAFLYRDCVITESILNVQSAQAVVEVDAPSLSFYAAPGEQSEPQILRIQNNAAGVRIDSISSPEGFLIDRAGQGYTNRIDSFTIDQLRQGAFINVAFKPAQAGGYYGTLAIRYANGSTRNVILKGWAYESGTVIAGGDVSGTWSGDKSPYLVTGNLRIPKNGQLVIEPGVKVLFTGSYSLTAGAGAKLVAEGSEAQPIELTAWNRETGWTGLRFVNSGWDDVLKHCLISYARKDAGLNPQDSSANVPEIDMLGGAIYCAASDPTIESCRIVNNVGVMGGAIYCVESSPMISNTLIANNTSAGGSSQCGGIFCDKAGVPEIRNCTIVNNFPGGLFTSSWDGMDVTNTIVWGNDRYQIYTNESTPTVTFCDVQDGYPGAGNIDVDPGFLNPAGGVGVEYDGASANWTLRTSSPCINTGTPIDELPPTDLAGAERIRSDVIDLGAYESQSDLPLMTATPSTTAEAGFVAVNASTTVVVELSNTGKLDFEIVDTSVPSGAFSVVAPIRNRLLTPGGSVQVEIRFRPTREKAYTETLLVRSTSSNAPVMQIALHGVGITGTPVPAGSVSGTWKKADSPYAITGDISIPRSKTLTIEPGVVVKFAGHFSLTAGYRATLRAVGTEQDRIVFTAVDINEGWFGLRFINSASEDQLKYCTIEYATKPRTGGGGIENLFGGAILCCSSWEQDPGFPLATSPTIDSCLIARNYARTGGAIMCYDGAMPVITNNTIIDNFADMDGGGIALYYADCEISNNVIARNYALVGGGIMNWESASLIRNNTIAGNKPSAMHLEAFAAPRSPPADVSIVNNIIWQNEIWLADDPSAKQYTLRYNDIQGGWAGAGNIDIDPLFANADKDDYHLKSRAGRWDPAAKAWVVDAATSPCIDAGDPAAGFAKEPQPNGQRVNLGAYGGTEQASKSPSDANEP